VQAAGAGIESRKGETHAGEGSVKKPKKPRPMRTEQELQGAAESAAYEVFRLKCALCVPWFKGDTINVHTAGLVREAFLVHFRNLLYFFYIKPRHPDDCHVDDFLPADSWTRKNWDLVDKYKQRCNSLLAHLSYGREGFRSAGQMVWDLDKMASLILEDWDSFLDSLPAHRREWFDRKTNELVDSASAQEREWFETMF
jgi:hypothetical protein